MNPSVSIKYGDLELRGSMNDFKQNPPIYTQEIVQWIHPEENKQYCFTVAYWKRDNEGFYLVYVGSRPMDISFHDQKHFLNLTTIGQRIADYIYVHGDIPL